MPIEAQDFKRALGQFATGVTVVTTRSPDGHPLGLTVNAFSSLSLQPPMVLVCIDNHSETNVGFVVSGIFAVSVLAADQVEWSRRFAVPGAAKFEAAPPLEPAHNGLLFVPGALAHIECRLAARHRAGDHTIYAGEVLKLSVRPGRPLVYHASGYRQLEPSEPAE
jgi:flavin reductase (DIM6/NTAB) family NADH-FMN oxidoreductase RutF